MSHNWICQVKQNTHLFLKNYIYLNKLTFLKMLDDACNKFTCEWLGKNISQNYLLNLLIPVLKDIWIYFPSTEVNPIL